MLDALVGTLDIPDDVDAARSALPALPADEAALEAAYRQHATAVFRFAMRCVSRRDLAEDLTSEAFLALQRNLDRVDVGQLPSWLFRVVKNRAIDSWRREKVERRYAVQAEPPVEAERGRSGAAAAAVPRRLLESRALKPIHRLCLQLRYVQGMSRGGGRDAARAVRDAGEGPHPVRARAAAPGAGRDERNEAATPGARFDDHDADDDASPGDCSAPRPVARARPRPAARFAEQIQAAQAEALPRTRAARSSPHLAACAACACPRGCRARVGRSGSLAGCAGCHRAPRRRRADGRTPSAGLAPAARGRRGDRGRDAVPAPRTRVTVAPRPRAVDGARRRVRAPAREARAAHARRR